MPEFLDAAKRYRDELPALRDLFLANAVFCGETPSPTFEEAELVQFLTDRFTEGGLENSIDEMGSISAIRPGKSGKRNILVAAHLDTAWETAVDHTVRASERRLHGVGLADNALGVAALVSLPTLLDRLGVDLEANLILLGATRSLGRGDLEGLRYFLDHTKAPVDAAICLEGAQLGRLSYSCLGMIRGVIAVTVPEAQDWREWGTSSAIMRMNQIITKILGIGRPLSPRTQIILGSISAGSGFTPPEKARLRFEVRSEGGDQVSRIQQELENIIAEINANSPAEAEMEIFARREPGDLGFNHGIVAAARGIMESLGVEPRIRPSISELSALLARGIPSLTLGLTKAEHVNELEESIEIEPVFDGLAQVIATLQAIDHRLAHE
ncbi:MAG: M20/M25/M40 family metallo-hydrolase [Verrucomicrobiales bacterium]